MIFRIFCFIRKVVFKANFLQVINLFKRIHSSIWHSRIISFYYFIRIAIIDIYVLFHAGIAIAQRNSFKSLQQVDDVRQRGWDRDGAEQRREREGRDHWQTLKWEEICSRFSPRRTAAKRGFSDTRNNRISLCLLLIQQPWVKSVYILHLNRTNW